MTILDEIVVYDFTKIYSFFISSIICRFVDCESQIKFINICIKAMNSFILNYLHKWRINFFLCIYYILL